MKEIAYKKSGDYYIPDLHQKYEGRKFNIGFFGRRRLEFLEAERRFIYYNLKLNEELLPHLEQINEQAYDRLETLIEQMTQAESVNEEMKTHGFEWLHRMNDIRNRALEIVLEEIVYA